MPSDKIESASWLSDEATQRILKVLNTDGAATRCVGGCVRDTLLGVASAETDVDMATTLTPDDATARLEAANIKVVPTGIAHGTITAIMDAGRSFEITTLRRDVATDGRHAQVAFTDDWARDAARRDFTINALYADADGTLHDPTGAGLSDLDARRIRFIGDAPTRIEEDVLRILRFFRFHFALAAETPFDADALAACRASAAEVARLSAARIRAELLRILALPDCAAAIGALHESGIWPHLWPPEAGTGTPDTLARLAMLEDTPDALLRLASLCDTTDGLAKRLHLSNADAERLAQAIAPLRLPPEYGDPPVAPLAHDMPPAQVHRFVYLAGHRCFTDRLFIHGARENWTKAQVEALHATAAAFDKPAFPLSGEEIMAAGIPQGREVGAVSRRLENWWIEAGFPDAEAVAAQLAALAD